MADSKILTVQYVRLEQTAASIGDRLLAQLIDWAVLLSYSFFVLWVISELAIETFWTVLLLMIFPLLFYTLLCELFNHGQSLGKMAMKTRVVKADGSSPSLGDLILRWMLYLIDGPLSSYMGVVVMMLTKRTQRLGDLAAGTMVIKLKKYQDIRVSLDEYDFASKDYKPRYPAAADLSLQQVDVITRTLQTATNAADPRVVQLATKVREKLDIKPAETTDELFLHRIVRDYQYYALEEI